MYSVFIISIFCLPSFTHYELRLVLAQYQYCTFFPSDFRTLKYGCCLMVSKTELKALIDPVSIDFFSYLFNLNVVHPDWIFLDCFLISSTSDVMQYLLYFGFNLFSRSLLPLLLFPSASLWSSVFLVLAHTPVI